MGGQSGGLAMDSLMKLPLLPRSQRFAGLLLPVVADLLPGMDATIAFLDYNDCYGQRLIAALLRSRQQFYSDRDSVLHQIEATPAPRCSSTLPWIEGHMPLWIEA